MIAMSHAIRLDNKSGKEKNSQNTIQTPLELKTDDIKTSQDVIKLIPELNQVIKNESTISEINKPLKIELIPELMQSNKIDILPEVKILSKQNVQQIIAEVAELDSFKYDRDMMLSEIDFKMDPINKLADIDMPIDTQDIKNLNEFFISNNQEDKNSNNQEKPEQNDESNTEKIKLEKFIYDSVIQILKEAPANRWNSKSLSNRIDIIVRQIINVKQREQIRNIIFNIIKATPSQGWKDESLKKAISDQITQIIK